MTLNNLDTSSKLSEESSCAVILAVGRGRLRPRKEDGLQELPKQLTESLIKQKLLKEESAF